MRGIVLVMGLACVVGCSAPSELGQPTSAYAPHAANVPPAPSPRAVRAMGVWSEDAALAAAIAACEMVHRLAPEPPVSPPATHQAVCDTEGRCEVMVQAMPLVSLRGTVTWNGAPLPGAITEVGRRRGRSRSTREPVGRLRLVDADDGRVVDGFYGNACATEYELRVRPGVYDLVFDFFAGNGARDYPAGELLVADDLVLDADRSLDLALDAKSVDVARLRGTVDFDNEEPSRIEALRSHWGMHLVPVHARERWSPRGQPDLAFVTEAFEVFAFADTYDAWMARGPLGGKGDAGGSAGSAADTGCTDDTLQAGGHAPSSVRDTRNGGNYTRVRTGTRLRRRTTWHLESQSVEDSSAARSEAEPPLLHEVGLDVSVADMAPFTDRSFHPNPRFLLASREPRASGSAPAGRRARVPSGTYDLRISLDRVGQASRTIRRGVRIDTDMHLGTVATPPLVTLGGRLEWREALDRPQLVLFDPVTGDVLHHHVAELDPQRHPADPTGAVISEQLTYPGVYDVAVATSSRTLPTIQSAFMLQRCVPLRGEVSLSLDPPWRSLHVHVDGARPDDRWAMRWRDVSWSAGRPWLRPDDQGWGGTARTAFDDDLTVVLLPGRYEVHFHEHDRYDNHTYIEPIILDIP